LLAHSLGASIQSRAKGTASKNDHFIYPYFFLLPCICFYSLYQSTTSTYSQQRSILLLATLQLRQLPFSPARWLGQEPDACQVRQIVAQNIGVGTRAGGDIFACEGGVGAEFCTVIGSGWGFWGG